MSSGNPFRRAAKQDDAPPTSAYDDRPSAQLPPTAPREALVANPSPPPKSKKHVRIRTPPPGTPISPEFKFSPVRARRDGSPPSGSAEETPANPFGKPADLSSSDDEEPPIDIERRDVAAGLGIKPGRLAVDSSGKPFNPFQKTLADIEPSTSTDSGRPTKDKASQQKTAMDVDSFARMLMGGKKESAGAAENDAKVQGHGTVVDSNSSTSSISRQSLFEAAPPAQTESPRTSYEMSTSDGDGDDDDGTSLVSAQGSQDKEKKKPPPAPKSRHGRGILPRAPQTVPFSDFSAADSHQQHSSPPALQRSPKDTDLNKPLPSLPETSTQVPQGEESSPTSAARPQLAKVPSYAQEVPQMQPPPTPQRKTPPAVPVSRRHSQHKNFSGPQTRNRSSSSLTINSQEEPSSPPSIAESSTSSLAQKTAPPPPPPPARRRANHSAGLATQLSSPTSGTEQQSQPGSLRQAFADAKQSPQSSLTSPPPPPPRRRGTSGRGSAELRRPPPADEPATLPNSHGGRRRSSSSSSSVDPGSIASPRKDGSPSALATPVDEESGKGEEQRERDSQSRDILADMDAFQAEIDALMKKGGGA